MKKPLLLLLLATVTGLAALAQANPPAAAKPHKDILRGGTNTITSDHFDMDTEGHKIVMIYTGHVHIDSADMHLACAKITSYPAASGGSHPERIVAEAGETQTNVVIDLVDDKGELNHVTGQLAVYEYKVAAGATNETVTVTGHPYIDTPMMFGPADVMVWNRATGHMSAKNPLFTSKQDIDAMMSHTNNPARATTNPPAPK